MHNLEYRECTLNACRKVHSDVEFRFHVEDEETAQYATRTKHGVASEDKEGLMFLNCLDPVKQH